MGRKKLEKSNFVILENVENLVLIHVATMIIHFTEKLTEPNAHLAPKFWEKLAGTNDE